MRMPWRAAVVAVGLALLTRLAHTELPIRLVRAIDQRLALFAPRGARAYARHAPRLLSGLYAAVVADAARRRPAPGTVVDIGSGPGHLLMLLAAAVPASRLVGIEPAPAMRELAAERLARETIAATVLDGAAELLPLPDASVDLIVSTLSAHHWSDPAAAFREIRRCLSTVGEARIYDVRFAAFTAVELSRLAGAAGWSPGAVRREVLAVRIGPFRPFAVAVLPAG